MHDVAQGFVYLDSLGLGRAVLVVFASLNSSYCETLNDRSNRYSICTNHVPALQAQQNWFALSRILDLYPR